MTINKIVIKDEGAMRQIRLCWLPLQLLARSGRQYQGGHENYGGVKDCEKSFIKDEGMMHQDEDKEDVTSKHNLVIML